MWVTKGGMRVWLEGRNLVGLADPSAGSSDVCPRGSGVIHELVLVWMNVCEVDVDVKELFFIVCLRVEGRGGGVLWGGDMEVVVARKGFRVCKVVRLHIYTKHFRFRLVVVRISVARGEGVVGGQVENIHGRYGAGDVSGQRLRAEVADGGRY